MAEAEAVRNLVPAVAVRAVVLVVVLDMVAPEVPLAVPVVVADTTVVVVVV